jgi:hypothetical protein
MERAMQALMRTVSLVLVLFGLGAGLVLAQANPPPAESPVSAMWSGAIPWLNSQR